MIKVLRSKFSKFVTKVTKIAIIALKFALWCKSVFHGRLVTQHNFDTRWSQCYFLWFGCTQDCSQLNFLKHKSTCESVWLPNTSPYTQVGTSKIPLPCVFVWLGINIKPWSNGVKLIAVWSLLAFNCNDLQIAGHSKCTRKWASSLKYHFQT